MTKNSQKLLGKHTRRIKILIKLPLKYKFLLAEAFLLTGIARFLIIFFPFNKIASLMGEPMKETPEEVGSDTLDRSKEITWFVVKVAKFTPWESKCLVQALTGQVMLRRRGIPSTIYLGLAKDDTGKLLAHAWLRCGSAILTGYESKSMYKQVACFGYSIST